MSSERSTPEPRQVLDGVIRVFLSEALLPITGLITAAFLTRKLGPGGYGLLSVAAVTIAWIEFSVAGLFGRSAVKFVAESDDWRPVGTTVIRAYLAAGLLAAVGVVVLATPIARLLDEPRLSVYLLLFAIDIPLFALARAHRAILLGLGRFRQRALAAAWKWLARLVLVILLVELGLSIEGAILGNVGASLVELVVARRWVRPSLSGDLAFSMRLLLSYATPLFVASLSMRLLDLDLVALKALGGTAKETGVYGAARNLSYMPGLLAMSISPLLLSAMSRTTAAGMKSESRAMGRQGLRAALWLLPLAAVTAGGAPGVMRLLFGQEYTAGGAYLAPLIFAGVGMLWLSVSWAVLIAASRPWLTARIAAPLVGLAAIGHLIWIPRLGALGAAWVTTLTVAIGVAVTALAMRRTWGVVAPQPTFWRALLLAAVGYGLAAWLPGSEALFSMGFLGLVLLVPIGFFLLGEFTRAEIDLAMSAVRP